MMSVRDFQSKSSAELKRISDTLKILVRNVDALQNRVNVIHPQAFLHPIPKPRNYQKMYGRDPNMASMFLKLVAEENDRLPLDAPRRYVNFPQHMGDEEANESAKRVAHVVMCMNLRGEWGAQLWGDICKSQRTNAAKVIHILSERPEFAVFSQGGGHWAVQMVVERRQKSNKRTADNRSGKQKGERRRKIDAGFEELGSNDGDVGQHLVNQEAVTVVPDLNTSSLASPYMEVEPSERHRSIKDCRREGKKVVSKNNHSCNSEKSKSDEDKIVPDSRQEISAPVPTRTLRKDSEIDQPSEKAPDAASSSISVEQIQLLLQSPEILKALHTLPTARSVAENETEAPGPEMVGQRSEAVSASVESGTQRKKQITLKPRRQGLQNGKRAKKTIGSGAKGAKADKTRLKFAGRSDSRKPKNI